MYAIGHYGAALLLYAPACAVLLRVEPTLALVGGAGVLLLCTLPDCDLRLPFVSHRGVTHTLGFVLLVSGLLGAGGWHLGHGSYRPFGGPLASAGFVFGIGLISLGSHVLADLLTPMGVAVLWPVSNRVYTVSLSRADDTLANWGLLAAGTAAMAAVVGTWH